MKRPRERSRWNSFRIYFHYAHCCLYYAYQRCALFLFPDELERYLLNGWFYGQMGLIDRSIEALKKALKIQPNSFAHWYLSYAYSQKGQHAESLLEWQKSLQVNLPEYIELNYLTPPHADEETQNIALEFIREVIELNPKFGGAYEHLGYIHIYRREWDKASEMLEKAIALGVTFPYTYLSLGKAYEMKGCWSEALQKYREAIHYASNPNFIKEVNNHIRRLEKFWGDNI